MIENRLGPGRQVTIKREMIQPSSPEEVARAKRALADFKASGSRTPQPGSRAIPSATRARSHQPRPRRAAAGSHLSVSQLKAKARDLRRDFA